LDATQAQLQQIIHHNLWDPPPPPADYDESKMQEESPKNTKQVSAANGSSTVSPIMTRRLVLLQSSPPLSNSPLVSLPKSNDKVVVVPGFRLVDDYDSAPFDPAIDTIFCDRYKAGLIVDLDSPNSADQSPSSTHHSHQHTPKNAIVGKFFDSNSWSEEETLLFKELLCAFGCDWSKISKLMMSKTEKQLEAFFTNNRYDLRCELCGSTADDQLLLLCDSCDRAYHTYCLQPPLTKVPTTAWFCTKDCQSIHTKVWMSCCCLLSFLSFPIMFAL
jgi:hypothetical protein